MAGSDSTRSGTERHCLWPPMLSCGIVTVGFAVLAALSSDYSAWLKALYVSTGIVNSSARVGSLLPLPRLLRSSLAYTVWISKVSLCLTLILNTQSIPALVVKLFEGSGVYWLASLSAMGDMVRPQCFSTSKPSSNTTLQQDIGPSGPTW